MNTSIHLLPYVFGLAVGNEQNIMASKDVKEQILDLLKKSDDAIETIQEVLNSFCSVNIIKPEPGDLFLTNEDQYLSLMMGALEYAIFPHAPRPTLASLVSIHSRETAWQWVVCQIRNNVTNEAWAYASYLSNLAQAFSKVFDMMGRCKFPIYLTPDKAAAWFDMWRMINETRMTRNNWSFLGENFDNLTPSLKSFRSMAEQNQQRIRTRYLRAMSLENGPMEDIPDAQPSVDEEGDDDSPELDPNEKLHLPLEIDLSLSGSNLDWKTSLGKRSRDEQDASSSKVSKPNDPGHNSSTWDRCVNEFGLPQGEWEDFLMDITAEDVQNALDYPLVGWAPYKDLYGCAPPDPVLAKDSKVALLIKHASTTMFYRGEDQDTLSLALRDAMAMKVPNSEWTTMDVHGKLVPTMEDKPYTIYRLQPRERCDHPIGTGPWAFRVGPEASGELAQYIQGIPERIPPGVRKASARELLQVLENPNQKGYPGTVNTDAILGFGVYTYQSADVLFGKIGARDELLVRLEGLHCKGHNDRGVCQKAKVAYCPCCVIPTHVAIPMSYSLGEHDARKQEAIDIWAQYGPWGQRRLCAIKYCYESNNRQPLPKDWDWAANSLHKAFPPPLIRGNNVGPPTEITTIGEARLARREKFLKERAREELCDVQTIRNKSVEIIQGKESTMKDVITSNKSTGKGSGKGVPMSTVGTLRLFPEAIEEDWQVKDRDDHRDHKGKQSFLLVDAIPTSTREDASDTSGSWRGGRRPKDSSKNQYTKRGGSSDWSSRNKWNK